MKLLAPIIIVMLSALVLYSVLEPNKRIQATDGMTNEEIKTNFQVSRAIDVKLLERIETIEKKLKITPPKDSIALKKKEVSK